MKELKDYLPLYAWCEVLFDKKPYAVFGVHREYFVIDMGMLGMIKLPYDAKAKIILRPLSDMSLAEFTDWLTIAGFGNISAEKAIKEYDRMIELVKIKGINAFEVGANEFYLAVMLINYLRKLHFDCDGLIPAGLAIDKTKHP